MTDERLNYHIGTTGAAKAEGDFKKVSASIASTSSMSGQATQNVSALGGAVGNLGTVVATASPQMGQFGGVIGTAASAVSGLTSVLGGPGGLVAGGLIAAVGLYATTSASAAKATDEATKAMNDQRQTVKDLTADFAALGASAEDARVRALEFRIGQIDSGQAQATGSERRRLGVLLTNARERASAARLSAEQQSDQAEFDRAIAEAKAFGEYPENDNGAARKAAEAEEKRFQGLIGGIAGDESQEAFMRRTTGRDVDAFLATQEQAQATLTDREKEHAQNRLKIFEENLKAREAAQKAHDDRMRASMEGFGEAGTEAFVRLAMGQEDAASAIIASIGNQMVAEGSRYVFRGGLELFAGNPAGAGMAALGLAEIAAGAALGATVSSQAPGAGAAGARTDPREPTRVDRRDDQIRRTTTVVHVDAMVADERAGEHIRRALERTDRVRGAA